MRSLPWRAPDHQSSARELDPTAPKGRADLRWDHAGGAQIRRRHDCHASSRTSLSVAKHYFTREYYREAICEPGTRNRELIFYVVLGGFPLPDKFRVGLVQMSTTPDPEKNLQSAFERIHDADGQLRGLYRKMHIPDDPLYYEKFYFTPGDLGYRAFDTNVGRVGTLVCWDQWYPEGARITALQGAHVLFYPTAIGWHPSEKAEFGAAQHDAWRTIQRAHAIANGVYVAVVNRVGFETGDIRGNSAPGAGLEFWGGSFLCDPFGRVIAEASHDKEEILIGEVDLRALEDIRRNWPFLRDRRIDSYAPITSRLLD